MDQLYRSMVRFMGEEFGRGSRAYRFGFFSLLGRTAPASALPDAFLACRTSNTLVPLAARRSAVGDAAEDSTHDAHRGAEGALARAAVAPRSAQDSSERFLVDAGRPERRGAKGAVAVAWQRPEGGQVESRTGTSVGRQGRVVAIQARRASIARVDRVGEQLQQRR